MHIKGSVSTESMHDRGWLQVVNKRQSLFFLLTLITWQSNSNHLMETFDKWPYGVMVSHQLDVLRVPRSILGEAKLFLIFLFFFCFSDVSGVCFSLFFAFLLLRFFFLFLCFFAGDVNVEFSRF